MPKIALQPSFGDDNAVKPLNLSCDSSSGLIRPRLSKPFRFNLSRAYALEQADLILPWASERAQMATLHDPDIKRG